MGCLTFIILAALGLLVVLVLGPVFAISDAIKWVLFGGLAKWLVSSGVLTGVAVVFVLGWLAFAVADRMGWLTGKTERAGRKEWEELDEPGNEEKKLEYWALLNRPEENLNKESYLMWLHKTGNEKRLEEWGEWQREQNRKRLSREQG